MALVVTTESFPQMAQLLRTPMSLFSNPPVMCPLAEAGLQGGALERMLMDLRSAVGVYVHVPEDSCLGQTTVARDEDTVYICIEPCGIQSF